MGFQHFPNLLEQRYKRERFFEKRGPRREVFGNVDIRVARIPRHIENLWIEPLLL